MHTCLQATWDTPKQGKGGGLIREVKSALAMAKQHALEVAAMEAGVCVSVCVCVSVSACVHVHIRMFVCIRMCVHSLCCCACVRVCLKVGSCVGDEESLNVHDIQECVTCLYKQVVYI